MRRGPPTPLRDRPAERNRSPTSPTRASPATIQIPCSPPIHPATTTTTLAILIAASPSGHSTRATHHTPHPPAPASLLAHLDLNTAPTHRKVVTESPLKEHSAWPPDCHPMPTPTYNHPQLGLICPGQLHPTRRAPPTLPPPFATDPPTLCPPQVAFPRSHPARTPPSWPPGTTMPPLLLTLNRTRAAPPSQRCSGPNHATAVGPLRPKKPQSRFSRGETLPPIEGPTHATANQKQT